jgi:hypothetical protein
MLAQPLGIPVFYDSAGTCIRRESWCGSKYLHSPALPASPFTEVHLPEHQGTLSRGPNRLFFSHKPHTNRKAASPSIITNHDPSGHFLANRRPSSAASSHPSPFWQTHPAFNPVLLVLRPASTTATTHARQVTSRRNHKSTTTPFACPSTTRIFISIHIFLDALKLHKVLWPYPQLQDHFLSRLCFLQLPARFPSPRDPTVDQSALSVSTTLS